MKPLFWVGLVILALGLGSFFVKLPRTETQTVSAGGMSVGMESTHSQTLPVTASVAMVLVGMIVAAGSLVPKARA